MSAQPIEYTLEDGDIGLQHSFTPQFYTHNQTIHATFDAPEGEQYVAMLLGTTRDGRALREADIEAMMDRLGWVRKKPEIRSDV